MTNHHGVPAITVAAPFAEVDAANVAAFRGWCAGLVDSAVSDGPGVVLMDFSTVEFFGAGGVGVLVEAEAALLARGVRLRIVNPSRLVRRVLSVCGVDARLID